jgi:hypothetical protein
MTAVLRDEVVETPPAQGPKLRPAPKPAPKQPSRQPIGGGDPLMDAATRLLSIPLREMYAVLWRVGVIEVKA